MVNPQAERIQVDWEHDEKMPRFDDMHDFEVWVDGAVRTVRRIGNRSLSGLTPGTLAFTDCRNPMQNVICHEPLVQAWRLKPSEAHRDPTDSR